MVALAGLLAGPNLMAGPVDDASQIGPGFAGFAVMFLLAVAVVLLMRSMVGHLRKVRYSPDPAADQPGPPDQPDRPESERGPGGADPRGAGD